MPVFDLTRPIHPDMPVFPGSEQPSVSLVYDYAAYGYRESQLCLSSHCGTHMDPPAHFYPGLPTLDQIPPDRFVGMALCLDCSHLPPGASASMDQVRPHQNLADQASYLIFNMGWAKYWGQAEYFGDYPVIGNDVAEYMLRSGKKALGVDTVSIDRIKEVEYPLHRALLQGGILIIENLCNLENLGGKFFTLVAAPLKISDSDGAPTRVLAMIRN
ncbi:cyclase family protein [Desulfovibrio sp. OttesenSCG-928-C14]|nr:cyclase family protein [Desulfovibrio sp. OttesenSCG-928-C14]